jgi:hypothetical protein
VLIKSTSKGVLHQGFAASDTLWISPKMGRNKTTPQENPAKIIMAQRVRRKPKNETACYIT